MYHYWKFHIILSQYPSRFIKLGFIYIHSILCPTIFRWQSRKKKGSDVVTIIKIHKTKFTQMHPTCSCPFNELKSSAFFSKDWTQTFLFCRHLEAAALFRSRNFLLFSSGSSLAALLRRPLVFWVCGVVWAGEAYNKQKWKLFNTGNKGWLKGRAAKFIFYVSLYISIFGDNVKITQWFNKSLEINEHC